MMLDDVWWCFGLWSSTGITRKITQWCPLALYFADTEIATITKLFRTGHALPTVFQYQVMQSRRALDSLQEPNVSLLDTTLQRARHGHDASEDRVLSSHCMPLANHVNHDEPCISCRHALGQSRTGRRHRPEFIQLVTWNVSWVHSFPSKPIPLEGKVETKNNVLSTNWN